LGRGDVGLEGQVGGIFRGGFWITHQGHRHLIERVIGERLEICLIERIPKTVGASTGPGSGVVGGTFFFGITDGIGNGGGGFTNLEGMIFNCFDRVAMNAGPGDCQGGVGLGKGVGDDSTEVNGIGIESKAKGFAVAAVLKTAASGTWFVG